MSELKFSTVSALMELLHLHGFPPHIFSSIVLLPDESPRNSSWAECLRYFKASPSEILSAMDVVFMKRLIYILAQVNTVDDKEGFPWFIACRDARAAFPWPCIAVRVPAVATHIGPQQLNNEKKEIEPDAAVLSPQAAELDRILIETSKRFKEFSDYLNKIHNECIGNHSRLCKLNNYIVSEVHALIKSTADKINLIHPDGNPPKDPECSHKKPLNGDSNKTLIDSESGDCFTFCGVRFNRLYCCAEFNDGRISKIGRTEMKIARALSSKPHKTFSKEELAEIADILPQSVPVFIKAIRDIFDRPGTQFGQIAEVNWLRTVHGDGYKYSPNEYNPSNQCHKLTGCFMKKEHIAATLRKHGWEIARQASYAGVHLRMEHPQLGQFLYCKDDSYLWSTCQRASVRFSGMVPPNGEDPKGYPVWSGATLVELLRRLDS